MIQEIFFFKLLYLPGTKYFFSLYIFIQIVINKLASIIMVKVLCTWHAVQVEGSELGISARTQSTSPIGKSRWHLGCRWDDKMSRKVGSAVIYLVLS